MVKLLAIINDFTKEISGELCVVNARGISTEKIGEALIQSNIYSDDNVHIEGFLLSTLRTYRANMVDQKFKCT
jgi:hypothetical protein